MRKITEKDVIDINNLYLRYGTYARVASALGIAPATVRRYIRPDFRPDSDIEKAENGYEDIGDEFFEEEEFRCDL